MERVTCRKMTRKSVFNYGRDNVRDLSVQQAIDLKKQHLIIRSYYGLSKIDFEESILNELRITPEYRIKKPSKLKGEELKEAIDKAMDRYYSSLREKSTDTELIKISRMKKKDKKSLQFSKNKAILYNTSKGRMQAKNHGR